MARNGNVLSVVKKSVCVVASQAKQHIFVWWKSFFAAEVLKLYIHASCKVILSHLFNGPPSLCDNFCRVSRIDQKSSRNIYSQHIFCLQTPSPLLTTIPTFRPPPQTQVEEAGIQAIKTLWDQLSQGPRRHNVSQYQTNFFLFGLL